MTFDDFAIGNCPQSSLEAGVKSSSMKRRRRPACASESRSAKPIKKSADERERSTFNADVEVTVFAKRSQIYSAMINRSARFISGAMLRAISESQCDKSFGIASHALVHPTPEADQRRFWCGLLLFWKFRNQAQFLREFGFHSYRPRFLAIIDRTRNRDATSSADRGPRCMSDVK